MITSRGKKQDIWTLDYNVPLALKMRIEIEWLEFACGWLHLFLFCSYGLLLLLGGS